MKFTRIVSTIALTLVTAVALSACKTIDTPDGKIPAEYVNTAKSYEGTYQGKFDGLRGELTFKMDGDMPVLTYSNSFGHDLLGNGCNSAIGKMQSVTVSDSEPVTIEKAVFELNPGTCNFEGRQLDVSVSKRGNETKIEISAIKGHYTIWIPGEVICRPTGGHHGHGPVICHETPGYFATRYLYVSGSFTKTN